LGVLIMSMSFRRGPNNEIIVDIKDIGEVEFPAGTSQKEIENALKKFPKSSVDEENEIAKYQAQLAGAGLGAAYSFGVPAMQTIVGKAGEAYRGGVPPAGPAPASGGAAAATTTSPAGGLPRAEEVIKDAGYLKKGSTGAQVYNFAKSLGFTDIEAANFVKRGMTASDVYELSQSQRSGGFRKVESIAPTETWRESGRGGIMLQEQGVGQGPKAQFIQEVAASTPDKAAPALRKLPPRVPVPEAKVPPLERVTNLYRQMMESPLARGAGAAMRVAAPPLALASAFGQAHDIYTEQQKEAEERDRITQALAAAGLLGTGMMMVPGGQIPGAALAIGAPAIQYAREKFR
jgi:hypothetical protein